MTEFPKDQLEIALALAAEIFGKRGVSDGRSPTNCKSDRELGMIAEFAVRSAFRMPEWTRENYPSFNRQKVCGDVGDCEVRGTAHTLGKLLFRQGDDDVGEKQRRNFALVVFEGDWNFEIAGWLPLPFAKKFRWKKFYMSGQHVTHTRTGERRGVFAVEQKFLWPKMHLKIAESGKEYRLGKMF